MAWLTGWNKRKAKIINGTTAGTQINYQMKSIIHKGSGTDTLTDTYLGTSIRDDFGDIRFTTSDGPTLLSYWIESYTSGSVATILVKIDYILISPGSVVIYLYYSNPSSTTTSSIGDTFIFGDDFVNLNNWTISTSNGAMTASVASSILTDTYSGVGSGYVYRNVSLGATNHVAEFEMYDNAISGSIVNWGAFGEAPAVGNDVYAGLAIVFEMLQYDDLPQHRMFVKDVNYSVDLYSIWGNAQWAKLKFSRFNGNLKGFFNDIQEISATGETDDSTYIHLGIQLLVHTSYNYTRTIKYKNFRIRNYTEPEPVYDAWGIEETLACNIPSCNLITTSF